MVGSILGDAFDKAIGLTLRHWRIMLGVWVVMGAAYFLDQTPNESIVALISIGIGPICATLAARSLTSGFEVRSSSILRYFLCSLLWSIATFVLPAILAAVFIPNFLHAREVGDTSIGPVAVLVAAMVSAMAFILWIGNKWSLASIVAFYRARPIAASFGKSWALTTGMFWQTLLFNISVSLAFIAVWFGPNFVAGIFIGVAYRSDPSKIEAAVRHMPAIFVPLLFYAEIAASSAYFRWLDRLDALHGDTVNS